MSIGLIVQGFGQIRNLGKIKRDYLFKKRDTTHTFSIWNNDGHPPKCYVQNGLLVMSQDSTSTRDFKGLVGKQVDLSKYRKVIFEIESATWLPNSYVWITIRKNPSYDIWGQGQQVRRVDIFNYKEPKTYPNYPNKYKAIIDVSELSGSYGVGLCIQSGGGSYGNIQFKNIYLEK